MKILREEELELSQYGLKKEAEISSEKEQNAPAENPSEEQPAKKPRKVFKFPKPAEPGEDDGGELEAKLAARAYKDAEIEAEELAKKEIEEEERKARAVRSLTKSKKIAIPKAFDPSQQKEGEKQQEQQQEQQEQEKQQQQQEEQKPEGELKSKVSLADVEALLENDDFDALEKLYEDYWG